MSELDGNGKTIGKLDQAIVDIKDDIKEINVKIDKVVEKLDKNTEELKNWCIQHDKLQATDLTTIRSDLSTIKTNKEGVSKIWVAFISGISGIIGAGLGITGLVVVKLIEGAIK